MHSVMQLFKKTMNDRPEQAAMLIEENDQTHHNELQVLDQKMKQMWLETSK